VGVAAAAVSKKARKKHRFRPGTRAMIEVRQQQRRVEPCVPYKNFSELAREIMGDISKERGEPWRVTREAFNALREDFERFATTLYHTSAGLSTGSGRKTLMVRDVRAMMQVVRDMGPYMDAIQRIEKKQ
jgi:histone H3-like centromeric protein A